MRKLLTAAVLVCAFAGVASAQTGPHWCGYTGLRSSGSDQQITVSTVALALTVPTDAVLAVVTLEDNPIRYLSTGTPTTSKGTLAKTSTVPVICVGSNQLATFRMIRNGGSDSLVDVEYFKR